MTLVEASACECENCAGFMEEMSNVEDYQLNLGHFWWLFAPGCRAEAGHVPYLCHATDLCRRNVSSARAHTLCRCFK